MNYVLRKHKWLNVGQQRYFLPKVTCYQNFLLMLTTAYVNKKWTGDMLISIYIQVLLLCLFHPFTFVFVQNPISEIINHERQPFSKWDFWLPVQQFLRFANIWFPHMWIISSVWLVFYCSTGINCFLNNLRVYKIMTMINIHNKVISISLHSPKVWTPQLICYMLGYSLRSE